MEGDLVVVAACSKLSILCVYLHNRLMTTEGDAMAKRNSNIELGFDDLAANLTLNIRIDAQTADALDSLCKTWKCGKSQAVRRAIRESKCYQLAVQDDCRRLPACSRVKS